MMFIFPPCLWFGLGKVLLNWRRIELKWVYSLSLQLFLLFRMISLPLLEFLKLLTNVLYVFFWSLRLLLVLYLGNHRLLRVEEDITTSCVTYGLKIAVLARCKLHRWLLHWRTSAPSTHWAVIKYRSIITQNIFWSISRADNSIYSVDRGSF